MSKWEERPCLSCQLRLGCPHFKSEFEVVAPLWLQELMLNTYCRENQISRGEP